MDEGTQMTIVEKHESLKYFWVIFKFETPKTAKYPEPESDLYFAVQGAYALYADYVAIKKDKLDDSFIEKWANIFRASRMGIE